MNNYAILFYILFHKYQKLYIILHYIRQRKKYTLYANIFSIQKNFPSCANREITKLTNGTQVALWTITTYKNAFSIRMKLGLGAIKLNALSANIFG